VDVHNLFSSPCLLLLASYKLINEIATWEGEGGPLTCIVKKNRIVYTGLVRKPGEKRPLGRPRRGWKENIAIDIKGIWRKGVDWTDMAQDRNCW